MTFMMLSVILLSMLTILLSGLFCVKWTEFQKSSHLTLMDFAEILSSQSPHQEMRILKILLSSCEWFQNYSYLNYGPFGLDIESL